MKIFWKICLITCFILSACSPTVSSISEQKQAAVSPTIPAESLRATELPQPVKLVIFADSSLSNLLPSIVAVTQGRHPGLTFSVRYGDSAALGKEIEQGAQVDIFISADRAVVDNLASAGFVNPQAVNTFVTGQLLVVMPPLNTANLTSMKDLSRAGLKLALADPSQVQGKYTQQLLDNMDKALGQGFKDGVLKNAPAYEQDATQVLELVQQGKVDAGIVYSSDLPAAPQLKAITIPSETNVSVVYSITVLSKSSYKELAGVFVEYCLSPDVESVLQKWGFGKDR